MAVLDNTTLAENIAKSQDIEMLTRFNEELNLLTELLGLMQPEVVAAGTAMFQYTVSGTLNDATVQEGDEVPLSEYNVTPSQINPITVKPYRKLTTAQAILKGGYEHAIARTDRKMVGQVRNGILTDFFTLMGNGTSSVSGGGLQAALAQASAKLQDETEKNDDFSGSVVHFVNPYDIADLLSRAQVTTQTVFGMKYIESFLGVENILVTNKVAAKKVYATPVENIHVYGIDFATLDEAGLSYTTQDGSLIGVHHTPSYNRTSAETYVLSGALFLPEYKNYIVTGSITDPEPQQVSVVGAVTTEASS